MVSHIVWFAVLSTLLVFSDSRTLCPRIFFQNINEMTMPYKIIEGVYVKENDYHNDFPVYRQENGNLLFYHTVSEKGEHFLVFGLDLKHCFGVAASVYKDPSSWLSSGMLDRNDVFDGLVYQWQYYNRGDQQNYYISTASSPAIKAVCVDEDFRECNSDRIYLNENFGDENGNILNDRSKYHFYRIQGLFRNLRPVYAHSAKSWYLNYMDGYWVVTSSLIPSSSEDAFMRVKDLALRPEYITKTWSVRYHGWRDTPSLRILCRGVTSMINTCQSEPCDSKANCVYTSGNETLCLCSSGYTGTKCSVNKQCPTPHPKAGTELSFAYFGNRPGDLGISSCSGSYPSMRYYLCVDNSHSSHWSGRGLAYTKQVPAATSQQRQRRQQFNEVTQEPWYQVGTQATPRAEPINFDDNPVILPVVLIGTIFVQLFLPFILWKFVSCIYLCKKVWEENDDQRRTEQVGEELGGRLEGVAATGSQEELDQGVQEYQEAVQEYQKETEEKELSRKRGRTSLCRLISLHMYVSFWLWVIYLVGCEASECTRYGRIFYFLRFVAFVMLGVSPLIVLVESIFCRELGYLKNIMQDETVWEYIHRMHQVPPRINMIVTCYHYETRTRVVYYTDANGNRQSRTETYEEMVVTFVDYGEFSFDSWVDVSKREMPVLNTAGVTRVKIHPSIILGDQETADDYKRQVAEMLERNRYRDEFTEYSSSDVIPGLEKRISAYADLSVRPFWIRPLFFWIATLLQMTWPYRWLFRAKTAKEYYVLKKKVYKSETPPREVDLMDPIAVLVDVASSVVISSVPDNICPAYSSEMNITAVPQPSTLLPLCGAEAGTDVPMSSGTNNPSPGSSTPCPPLSPYTGRAFPPRLSPAKCSPAITQSSCKPQSPSEEREVCPDGVQKQFGCGGPRNEE